MSVSYPKISEVNDIAKEYEEAAKVAHMAVMREDEEDGKEMEKKIENKTEINERNQDDIINAEQVVDEKNAEKDKIEEENVEKPDYQKYFETIQFNYKPSEENTVKSLNESAKDYVEKESWSRPSEFVFALIASGGGFDAFLRFPFLLYRNGGIVFLIPFIVCFFLVGMPLMVLEAGVAQYSGLGVLGIWDVCPLFRGMGLAVLFTTTIIGVYYNTVLAWFVMYMYHSFSLRWSTCDNLWNTEKCAESFSENKILLTLECSYDDYANCSQSFSQETSSSEFWKREILQISMGIEDLGCFNVFCYAALAFSCLITYLCIFHGVRQLGKVCYVTVILPILVLIGLLSRGSFLDHSYIGVMYIFMPDYRQLMSLSAWMYAIQTWIVMLGSTSGVLMVYASHNKYHNNLIKQSLIVGAVLLVVSVLSAFVVSAFVGYQSFQLNVSFSEIMTAGPELVFVMLMDTFKTLPSSSLLSFLLFFMLFINALSFMFGNVMVVSSALKDTLPQSFASRNYLVVAVVILFNLILGASFAFGNGIYQFNLLDQSVYYIFAVSFAFLECFIFSYLYGINRLYENMESMFGGKMSVWWRVCWMVFTPAILVFVTIYTLVFMYSGIYYGDYTYPFWSLIVSWVIRLTPLFLVLIFSFVAFCTAQGTFSEKMKSLVRPTDRWENKRNLNTLPKPT